MLWLKSRLIRITRGLFSANRIVDRYPLAVHCVCRKMRLLELI